jgi:hypothetical protein
MYSLKNLFAFLKPISLPAVKKMLMKDIFTLNEALIGKQYTIDGRLCISSCTSSSPPNKNGYSSIKITAFFVLLFILKINLHLKSFLRLTQSRSLIGSSESSSEGIPDTDNVAANAADSLQISDLVARKTAEQIRCEVLGNDPLFIGPTGKQFRVQCPKECGKSGIILLKIYYFKAEWIIFNYSLNFV